jgi:hypothetical protein
MSTLTERPPLEVGDVIREHGEAFLVRHGPRRPTFSSIAGTRSGLHLRAVPAGPGPAPHSTNAIHRFFLFGAPCSG